MAGGIIGGVLGAFSAASTGGDVLEGAIEGSITGAVGSICGIFGVNPILAGLIGCGIDVGVQTSSHYLKNNNMNTFEIDWMRAGKTGFTTGLGVAIPMYGVGPDDAIDALGTAVIWAEGSTLITSADIIATNVISNMQTKSVGTVPEPATTKNTSCRIKTTIADYFKEQYNSF